MAIEEYEVQPLFAEPFFRTNIGHAISDEQIRFLKNLKMVQMQLTPEREKQNIFNTPMNIVTPQAGEVVLFSSGIQHLVETNASKEPRYSVAFNTFIKGRLGDFRDVSELTL